jgi:uncharacterized protein YdbL (DUF1318 family)
MKLTLTNFKEMYSKDLRAMEKLAQVSQDGLTMDYIYDRYFAILDSMEGNTYNSISDINRIMTKAYEQLAPTASDVISEVIKHKNNERTNSH